MFRFFGDCFYLDGRLFHDGDDHEERYDSKTYRLGVMTRSIFVNPQKKFNLGEIMQIQFGVFSDPLQNIRVGYENEKDDMEYWQESESPQGTLTKPVESLIYYPQVYMSRNAYRIMFACDCPLSGNFLLERIDMMIAVRRQRGASIAEPEG
jgi:hypothetical protein